MSKDSNIVQFPQKSEEQKQLDLLNKQFVEIETQGSEIEDQTRRVNDFVRKQRELTDLNHDGHE
jgi:hypothetical protein